MCFVRGALALAARSFWRGAIVQNIGHILFAKRKLRALSAAGRAPAPSPFGRLLFPIKQIRRQSHILCLVALKLGYLCLPPVNGQDKRYAPLTAVCTRSVYICSFWPFWPVLTIFFKAYNAALCCYRYIRPLISVFCGKKKFVVSLI